jgi:hypothetical protein
MSETVYVGASRSSDLKGAKGVGRAVVVGMVAWWNGVGRCARLCAYRRGHVTLLIRVRDIAWAGDGYGAGEGGVWWNGGDGNAWVGRWVVVRVGVGA